MELTKEMATAVAELINLYPDDFFDIVGWQQLSRAREDMLFRELNMEFYKQETKRAIREFLDKLREAE